MTDYSPTPLDSFRRALLLPLDTGVPAYMAKIGIGGAARDKIRLPNVALYEGATEVERRVLGGDPPRPRGHRTLHLRLPAEGRG